MCRSRSGVQESGALNGSSGNNLSHCLCVRMRESGLEEEEGEEGVSYKNEGVKW